MYRPTQRPPGGRRMPLVRRGRWMAEVYENNSLAVFRLALLLTGDVQAANDVTQDVFLRLFSRFRDLWQPDSLPSYLRRTTINLVHDQARRRTHDRARMERHARAYPSTEVHLPDVALHGALIQTLRNLPERQRTALVLRYFEDLGDDQIAAAMNSSESAVKNLIHRGLAGLRDEMRGEEWT